MKKADVFQSPASFRSAVEFREAWRALGPEADCDLELDGENGSLAASIDLLGCRLENRFAVHPMEGWDGTAEGHPGELTHRRWRRFGESGASLIWGGEACAVQQDGRANPRQLLVADGGSGVQDLQRLLRSIDEGRSNAGFGDEQRVVGLQLTHSGRFAQPGDGAPRPRVAYRHPVLDARVGVESDVAVLSDAELEDVGAAFVSAAKVAHAAGFDFVDIKCCHGYLLHELLSASTREGPYGGSLENRTRLFCSIVQGIRAECPDLGIGVRVSICDTIPHSADPETGVGVPVDGQWDGSYIWGFGVNRDNPLEPDLKEPLGFLDLLKSLDINLVNVTVGSPYYSPHLQRPARYPPTDGYLPPEDPMASVLRQICATRACKAAHPEMVLVGSGYTYLQEWLAHVAQHEIAGGHVDFVGLGRMMLSYPGFPADVLRGGGVDRRQICRTFSDCTNGPRAGLVSGCYPLDDFYRERDEAAEIRRIRGAQPKGDEA